jgi:serine/threonine-protein kinase
LELLTGKPPNTLFDKYSSTWNWRSYVKVSDRLAAVLDKMLLSNHKDRYTVASEVLHDLSYKSPTYQIPKTQPSPQQSPTFPQTPSFPYKKTIGVGVGVVAIAALIALPFMGVQPFCQLINTCELTTQKDRTARQDYNQAVQKADSAWDSIDENSDIQQLQSARDKMNLAIQDLENIPQETEVYSEVEQKLPEYRSKLQEIDDRILLQESQEIAQEAERTAENYQNIQQLEESLSGYQQAIDKLDRVSTNSPIEGEVKDTRERYQTELAKIDQNLEREQKAKNLLQEAEKAASSAQQTTKNARTIAEYERANTQWKEAIEKIKTIPEDSLVHSRSQSLAQTYRQEQRKVQNTIADRKAQQQEPEQKERSEQKDPTEQQQDCERGVLGLCKE